MCGSILEEDVNVIKLREYRLNHPSFQLTPTTLRWSALSPPLAQKELLKFSQEF